MLKQFLIILFTFCAGLQAVVPEGQDPNVLMIAVDDLKPLIGIYGHKQINTPNLDRLGHEGTVFLNSHCQQAVCGPSRASLLTGLRPDTTRIWDFEEQMRNVLPEVVTLPQHFKNNGYFTVGMGKIFDGRCCDGWETQDIPSWSVPFIRHRNPNVVLGHYANPDVRDLVEEGLRKSEEMGITDRKEQYRVIGFHPSTECLDYNVPDNTYTDGLITETAMEWMDKLSSMEDKPFFLAVGFMKPHLPFVAPKKYWDMYDPQALDLAPYRSLPAGSPSYALHNSGELRSAYLDIPREGEIPEDIQRRLVHGYYACVSYIDAQIGMLLDKLEEQGLKENTIIVLWGDHGWHLGDHGVFCKHTNYEQATRAPLIFSYPGLQHPHSSSNSPVEFIDIFPTIVDLAGLEPPDGLQGLSLVPVMKNPLAMVKPFAVSQYRRTVVENGQSFRVMGYAYRNQRYRYVQWRKQDYKKGELTGPVIARELFDYVTDPAETINLVDDPVYGAVIKAFERDIE